MIEKKEATLLLEIAKSISETNRRMLSSIKDCTNSLESGVNAVNRIIEELTKLEE